MFSLEESLLKKRLSPTSILLRHLACLMLFTTIHHDDAAFIPKQSENFDYCF